MSSPSAFQPDMQPSLRVRIKQGSGGLVSVVIFELGDEHLGGMRRQGSTTNEVICTEENVRAGLCRPPQLGEFLISDLARETARHTLMTRAVNVSSPVPLLYPVSGPGLYCVAAVPFTSKTFSATLHAKDPGSGKLPAFRAPELFVYQRLGPAWIALVVSMLFRWFETSTPLCWLVPLSGAQVALRWCGVELGDRHSAAVTIKAMWCLFETIQVSAVISHTYHMTTAKQGRDWFVGASVVVLVGLSVAKQVADSGATAFSQASTYVHVVLDFFLAVYTALCLARMRHGSKNGVLPGNWAPVAVLLSLVCLAFGVMAGTNAWMALQRLSSWEFGQRYWRVRVWATDIAYQGIMLMWTLSTAMYCGWQPKA